jgi:hypothetical protein
MGYLIYCLIQFYAEVASQILVNRIRFLGYAFTALIPNVPTQSPWMLFPMQTRFLALHAGLSQKVYLTPLLTYLMAEKSILKQR